MKLFFFLMLLISSTFSLFSHSADDILGYWYAPLKTDDGAPPIVVVEFFKHNGMYYAYSFGWKDPLYIRKNWKDSKNPNKDLRQRDINGTVFVFDIKFNTQSKKWEQGKIYQYNNGNYYHFTAGKLSPDKATLRWRAGLDKLVVLGKNLDAWTRIPQEDLQIHLDKEDKPSMDEVIKTITQK